MATLPPNHIYQYSLINALMSGVSSPGLPVAELLSKGPSATLQGLGTFLFVKGELVLLDGKCYQLQPHGRIRIASPDDECPYVAVTNFVAEHTFEKLALSNKNALDTVLSDWGNEAANLFISYRIEGRFAYLRCRTVEGQKYEDQPLSEVAKNQVVDEYHDVEGTIVGFRSPAMWQGFAVAGQHLHFIDRERKRGGHVLELRTGDEGVKMGVAVAVDVHIELPRSKKFNDAEMKTDDMGVRAVEG